MNDEPGLIYLEADDEITSVVRRVRETDASPIVVVAPGRSRATSSVVALRLLGRAAEAEGRTAIVVGDALTRSLAADAGIPAFASVDEARRADGAIAEAQPAQQATIRIVRGPVDAQTVAGMAAVAASPFVDAETRPVPVVKAPPRAGPRPWTRLTAGRRGLTAVGIGVAAALILGGFAGAAFLPAATITLVPRTSAVGPERVEVAIASPQRTTGTVEETATVQATGTYPIEESAAGEVTLYNWTAGPVAVPAGTFVAAGEQAFATQADVVVPPGSLTPDGRIAAGDVTVAVVAAAAGPDANVPAGAIDTVVNEGVDQQLRGFLNNPERTVENLAPMAGGLIDSGPEFTPEDVDKAVTALNEGLAGGLDAALAETEGSVFADPPEAPRAQIEGVEDLVGKRDQDRAEITGTLAYDRLSADPETVKAEATGAFEERASTLVPEGQELLADATVVTIGEARQEGTTLIVTTSVSGSAAASIDPDEVIERTAGLTAHAAEAALTDLGDATVDLWPGWVSTVPEAAWRVEVVISGVEPSAVPSPS
ncbi:MAG TPA: baseplate J/gp47 family protein [Candidatus Limnocylindria bacterium]|nr:baseplate J/gp47 family protein [Candidatus Limnocylindria bacterium]